MHSRHSSVPHQAPTLRFELQRKSPGIQSNTGGSDAPIVPEGSEDAGALNDDILVSSTSGPTGVSMETHPIVRILRPAIVLNPAPDRKSSDTSRATQKPAHPRLGTQSAGLLFSPPKHMAVHSLVGGEGGGGGRGALESTDGQVLFSNNLVHDLPSPVSRQDLLFVTSK